MITLEKLLLENDVYNAMSKISEDFCNKHRLPKIDQLAFCISKVEELQRKLSDNAIISTFLVSEAALPNWIERGRTMPFKGRVGITYYDSMQLEFLESGIGTDFYSQLSSSSSETRLHHLGFFVEELDSFTTRLASAGYPIYVVGKSVIGKIDVNFHYIDTFAELGFYLEFICCSINGNSFIPEVSLFQGLALKQKQFGFGNN